MWAAFARNPRLCVPAAVKACAEFPLRAIAVAGSDSRACYWPLEQRRGLSNGSDSPREDAIASILESKIEASKAVVHDISGGCGSMYKIEVESPLFRGKGLVAQHRMVKAALATEIADMHGLTLLTRPSPP
ncbi:conserved unknown protein [Ectocarpus siliculosus]|uniref:BolA-like protein n=1 Tax=Ectocarpus siliculosus TaxID=2880 RepID=D7G906_ECTSI|nr:conserved unknown protein [Ectocarpus siliculosus]|eukprot:CBJ28167.1 conserved unknown protein [Ectocarpus siliculosus]